MIVVANPSGAPGQSFKHLHAYCAHDPDRAESNERVDWISTRNLSSDPDRAWKEMVATSMMADQLKAAAGIRAGRKTTKGPVMHLVLSFDKDEDTSREAMEAAADKALASLGVDPAKTRGKSKPSLRQFADEHQSIMYAHSDTKNTHLHIMLNTVHPEHGKRLPTSNNYDKLQRWALKHSREVGTAANYPVREENAQARDRGEYVKGPKRHTRNMWELREAVRPAVNDNNRAEAILAQQKAKDAALLKHSRSVAARQKTERTALDDGYKEAKAALKAELKRGVNRDKAAIREEFRPKYRALKANHAHEREVFAALEKSVFGRASNMAKSIKSSRDDVRDGENSGAMARAFRIITRASERKEALDRKQAREEKALKADHNAKLSEVNAARKQAHSEALGRRRELYLEESAALRDKHETERLDTKAAWDNRVEERRALIQGKVDAEPSRKDLIGQVRSAQTPRTLSDYLQAKELSREMRGEFEAQRKSAREQGNEPDRERGEE